MAKMTHIDDQGQVQQVDVSAKSPVPRRAIARARISLPPVCHALLASGGESAKGNVFTIARIAGIQAAKRCYELIPLCHQIPLDGVQMSEELGADYLELRAEVCCTARTGVEMEALSAASVAALCVYDMLKALSHDMVISQVELLRKEGGRSGLVERRPGADADGGGPA